MSNFTDFPNGLNSLTDYLNPQHHSMTGLAGSPADLSRIVQAAQFDGILKELICGLLAGNGLKLPNIQICISINLSRILGLPNLQAELQVALTELSNSMNAFLDHTTIDSVLGRINNVLADATNIANMLNFCSSPMDPIAIPNVLEQAMQSFLGPGMDLMNRLGTMPSAEIGGCLLDSGNFNCGAFTDGLLGLLADNCDDLENGTLDGNLVNSVVQTATTISNDLLTLIETENGVTGLYDNGGSDFTDGIEIVNESMGVLHNATAAGIQGNTRIASQLRALYENLGSYQVVHADGTVYNNVFELFVDSEFMDLLRNPLNPVTEIVQKIPVYNYCGEIVGYTDSIQQPQASYSRGISPTVRTQPGYDAGGITTNPAAGTLAVSEQQAQINALQTQVDDAQAVKVDSTYATYATLLAGTKVHTEGEVLWVVSVGAHYVVAATGASDHDRTMASGTKLYIRSSKLVAWGADATGATDVSALVEECLIKFMSCDLGGGENTWKFSGQVGIPENSVYSDVAIHIHGDGANCVLYGVDELFTSEQYKADPTRTDDPYTGKIHIHGLTFREVGASCVFDMDHLYNCYAYDNTFINLTMVGRSSHPKDLGAAGNKVVSGDFSVPGDWYLPAGWSISGGKAIHTTGYTDALVANSTPGSTAGTYCAIKYTVTNRTAGTITPNISSVSGTAESGNGRFIQVIEATNTDGLIFIPSSDFDGELTDVEYSEVYPEGYSQSFNFNNNHFRVTQIVDAAHAFNFTFSNNMCENCPYGLYFNNSDMAGVAGIAVGRFSENLFEGGGTFLKVIDYRALTVSGLYLEANNLGDAATLGDIHLAHGAQSATSQGRLENIQFTDENYYNVGVYRLTTGFVTYPFGTSFAHCWGNGLVYDVGQANPIMARSNNTFNGVSANDSVLRGSTTPQFNGTTKGDNGDVWCNYVLGADGWADIEFGFRYGTDSSIAGMTTILLELPFVAYDSGIANVHYAIPGTIFEDGSGYFGVHTMIKGGENYCGYVITNLGAAVSPTSPIAAWSVNDTISFNGRIRVY